MTYEEAREYIDDSGKYGSVLGLTTMTELMNRLGNPQDRLKLIHVGGTNGKGSTTAMIASILACAGYRVGRYISPAVFSYRERIQISKRNNYFTEDSGAAEHVITEFITKEGVRDAILTLKPVCEAMVREGFAHPTSFELETAMAYLYLYKEQVDYAVIEVGLGGRLDATNVMKQPVCSVITPISMDHMQYLGDTLEKIAGEKAGIIKPGAPVITCNTRPEILQTLRNKAEEMDTSLTVTDAAEAKVLQFSPEGTAFSYLGKEYVIKLLGEHQLTNAVLAIKTAEILQQVDGPLDDQAILQGLISASWSGRFEIIARNPYFIIDGAHNEDAALHLKKSIELYFNGRRIIFIMGVFADKDYQKILELTAPLAEVILAIASDNSRALASGALAAEAKKYTEKEVIDAGTAKSAVLQAYEIAREEDVIIAFGSLSFLGELRRAVIPRSVPED